jgi:hypothetical protein
VSASTPRAAAALIRQRAEAAAHDLGEPATDPWTWRGIGTGYREPIHAHIGSWHPAVALAVADLIDTILKVGPVDGGAEWDATVTIARTYLGDPA